MQPLLFSSTPFFLLAVPCFFLFLLWCDFRAYRRPKKKLAPAVFVFFFSVKRLQFSFGTFSKIRLDNFLALLIFVDVPTLILKYTSFPFLKLFVFSLSLKVNWSGGENAFTSSLRLVAIQSFKQVKLQYHHRKKNSSLENRM